MSQAKYHAGKPGLPLCGTRSTGNRYCVVVVSPSSWNAMNPDQRCSKCIAKLQLRKLAKQTNKGE